MKDPVCGAQVDEKNASATSMHQGQKYAFCGKDCKEKFDKEPQRYAHAGQAQHVGQQGHGQQQHEKPLPR